MDTSIETPFGIYEIKPGDKVTVFNDGKGFSLLSDYPEGQFEGKKMMIKVWRTNKDSNVIVGSTNMIEYKEVEGDGYPIIDNSDGKFPVWNFNFNTDDGVTYDTAEKKFKSKNSTRTKSTTEFIDILSYNHRLPNRVPSFFERMFPRLWLNCVFWLVDLSYAKDASIIDLIKEKGGKPMMPETIEPDPFFKYFKISKNLLLVSLILTAIYYRCNSTIDVDVTNGFLLLTIAIALLLLEKLTAFFLSQVKAFKDGEDNHVRRLHAKRHGWYTRSFDLIW